MFKTGDAYRSVIETFASEGARIIRLDRTTRYPTIGRLATRPLEPGFIPIDGPPRLVTVSFYPNSTEQDTGDFRLARESSFRWSEEGDSAAYASAYRDWLGALPKFPFHRDFDRPIFDAVGIADAEFAWLPLVKAPLSARTAVSDDDVFVDRMLLWDQLLLLKPRVILAQGMKAGAIVTAMCDGKFEHTVVVQKIGRYGSTASHQSEDERVIREVERALVK